MTRRHFRNFIFFPCIAIAAIITLIWLITPLVAKHYLTTYFEQQGEKVVIDTLSVNFFPPRIEIKNLHISQQENNTLSLKEAIVEVKILPLLSRSVFISAAKIDGLELAVMQQQDSWTVAGIKLDQYLHQQAQNQANEEETTKTDSAPWTIKLPSFAFTNSVMHLSRQAELSSQVQTDEVAITSLTVTNLSGSGLNWQGQTSLSAAVNDAKLGISTLFDYSADKINATIYIDNTSLPISSFRHFLPSPYNAGKGTLGIEGQFKFVQHTGKSGPSYEVSDLDLMTRVESLDLILDDSNQIATESTLLDLNKVQIQYVSTDDMKITGGLNLSSQQTQFHHADQSFAFQQLKLNNDIGFLQQQEAITFSSQQTSLFLNQLAARLSNNQSITLDALALSLPINLQQNEQGLSVDSTTAVLNTENLVLALDSLALNNGKTHLALSQFKLTQDPKKRLAVSVESNLKSHELSIQQADIAANYQTFNLSGRTTFQQDGNAILLHNSNLILDVTDVLAQKAKKEQVTLGKAHLTAEQLDISLADKQVPSIKGIELNFSSQDVDSKLSENKRLAAWQKASFSHLDFSSQGDKHEVKLAEFTLSNLTLSEALGSEPALAPLAQIADINIQQLEATQDGAKVKQVTTDSVKVNLLIDDNRHLENLVFVDQAEQEARGANDQASTTPKAKDAQTVMSNTKEGEEGVFKAPYYIILDAYDLSGQSIIYVTDKSISPTLQRSLEINTLSLRNLNTKEQGQAAVFALQAQSGKYTTIENDITIWPMADELTMKTTLTIKEAELPPYSSYIADVLGYQIDSGQLDLDINLNADNGELDGSSHIVLREFDLGGREESHSVIQAGAVPLNLAVSILKDSDNNIDLDIPLSGNIDNPKFGWQDFLLLPVRKALFSASSSYLIQTFVPYANVISIAQFAGDQLLKIRVEPLLFEAENANLHADQTSFLEQLVALMKEKNDSQLKACGITSFLDIGFDAPPVTIDDDTRATAKQLAEQRANHLKDYLVGNGISSSRIFLCSPEVDLTRDSKPRVELKF